MIKEELDRWSSYIGVMANKFKNLKNQKDDLFNEGVVALLEGEKNYLEKYGNYEAYIKTVIRRRIHDKAVSGSFCVHFPAGSLRTIKGNSQKIKSLQGIDIQNLQFSLYSKRNIDLDLKIDLNYLIKKYDKNNIAKLYFKDGLNYEEIVNKTGINIATISRHINYIIKIIRKKYS